jgi:hypothetical protein
MKHKCIHCRYTGQLKNMPICKPCLEKAQGTRKVATSTADVLVIAIILESFKIEVPRHARLLQDLFREDQELFMRRAKHLIDKHTKELQDELISLQFKIDNGDPMGTLFDARE